MNSVEYLNLKINKKKKNDDDGEEIFSSFKTLPWSSVRPSYNKHSLCYSPKIPIIISCIFTGHILLMTYHMLHSNGPFISPGSRDAHYRVYHYY
jgi:hypothetical protein